MVGASASDSRKVLPTRMILDGSYRILRVVGSGGFGITYEAEDINLDTMVAIKEYYPYDYGERDGTMSVRPRSERHKETFDWGKANFLQEARTLARFEHPSIVRVTRVFEAHCHCLHGHALRAGEQLRALAAQPRPTAHASRARPHRGAAARCAGDAARGRFPASRHRTRQHHRAPRWHASACSTLERRGERSPR